MVAEPEWKRPEIRREIKLLSNGAGSVPFAVFPKISDNDQKGGFCMKFGISTSCFYPALTEEAAAILAQRRVPAAEVFLNAPSEMEREYLCRLRDVFRAGGTEVLSVHPFSSGLEPLLLFSEYPRRFADGVRLYRHYFVAAALLGARYFGLHGDRREGKTPAAFYFERFAALDEAAREYGVRVAQENVARCRGGSLAFLREMKAALPDAAFVLDLKQARRAGEDWREILAALGENVRHIHLSGCGAGEDCLPLTRGNFELREFLSALRAAGFDGGVMLELYRENYGGYEELFESLAIAEKVGALL